MLIYFHFIQILNLIFLLNVRLAQVTHLTLLIYVMMKMKTCFYQILKALTILKIQKNFMIQISCVFAMIIQDLIKEQTLQFSHFLLLLILHIILNFDSSFQFDQGLKILYDLTMELSLILNFSQQDQAKIKVPILLFLLLNLILKPIYVNRILHLRKESMMADHSQRLFVKFFIHLYHYSIKFKIFHQLENFVVQKFCLISFKFTLKLFLGLSMKFLLIQIQSDFSMIQNLSFNKNTCFKILITHCGPLVKLQEADKAYFQIKLGFHLKSICEINEMTQLNLLIVDQLFSLTI